MAMAQTRVNTIWHKRRCTACSMQMYVHWTNNQTGTRTIDIHRNSLFFQVRNGVKFCCVIDSPISFRGLYKSSYSNRRENVMETLYSSIVSK